MRIEAIQRELAGAGIDGWLFCDFHHRDLLAYRILGLEPGHTSRRWFYFVPVVGQPVKLSHRVEPTKLERLPGRQEFYLRWTELHEKLQQILGGRTRVAMQYSPMNNIPYVSLVDAGTVELVRSFGVEVVSSADLVQTFEALTDDAGMQSHRRAGKIVQRVKDEAFDTLARALRDGRSVSEVETTQFILSRFADEGLTADGATPIVGFNDHPADPHFEPRDEIAYTIGRGDTILIDLWAREDRPSAMYYDVTWCGYAGTDPPAEYREIFDTVCRARDAALEFVRRRFSAGDEVRGFEVDRVCRDVVVRAGYGEYFLHRTGHSIGAEVHGNGANIDDLETRDDRRIVPGSIFSVEPGIYLAGRMAVRSEIDVLVTPAGAVEVAGAIQDALLLI